MNNIEDHKFKPVTGNFITADGSTYETETEAQAHQFAEIMKRLTSLLYKDLDHGIGTRILADWLYDNRDILREYFAALDACDTQTYERVVPKILPMLPVSMQGSVRVTYDSSIDTISSEDQSKLYVRLRINHKHVGELIVDNPTNSSDLVKHAMGSFFTEDIKPENIKCIEVIPYKQVNIITTDNVTCETETETETETDWRIGDIMGRLSAPLQVFYEPRMDAIVSEDGSKLHVRLRVNDVLMGEFVVNNPAGNFDMVKHAMESIFTRQIEPEEIHRIEVIPNKQVNIVTKEGSGQSD